MGQTEFDKVAQQFVDAWNSHDMRALAALFTDDGEFVNVYGSWWTGRQMIESEHAKPHATIFRLSVLSASELRSKMLSQDSGHLHMRWKLIEIKTPDGTNLPERTGVMLFVMKRVMNEWLIAAAQNTDISAPPMPPAISAHA